MDKQITTVIFNQRQGRIEVGEQVRDFISDIVPNHHAKLGSKVKLIFYHTPAGDGDRHYVDVQLEDGKMRRVFDIDDILWE